MHAYQELLVGARALPLFFLLPEKSDDPFSNAMKPMQKLELERDSVP